MSNASTIKIASLSGDIKNCTIGKQYCSPGVLCDPVEGCFVTECNIKDCKNFG